MRFKLTLKSGFTTVGEGEIIFDMKEVEDTSNHTNPSRIEAAKEEKVGRWMLEIEHAINSLATRSALRAHIETL